MKVQYAMISRFTVRLLSDILAAKRLPAYDNLRINNERPPTPPLIAFVFFFLFRSCRNQDEVDLQVCRLLLPLKFDLHKRILYIHNSFGNGRFRAGRQVQRRIGGPTTSELPTTQ